MNELGYAVGRMQVGGEWHAFAWIPEGNPHGLAPGVHDLHDQAAHESIARKINENGFAVGESTLGEGGTHAIEWTPIPLGSTGPFFELRDLGSLGGGQGFSSANDVNDSGWICGATDHTTSHLFPFIEDGVTMTRLQARGCNAAACAINSWNDVVVYGDTADCLPCWTGGCGLGYPCYRRDPRVFLNSAPNAHAIAVLPEFGLAGQFEFCQGEDINDLSLVAGYGNFVPDNCEVNALLWRPLFPGSPSYSLQRLGVLESGRDTFAYSLNDFEVVVGTSRRAFGSDIAWVHEPAVGFRRLEDQIGLLGTNSTWEICDARDITNSGVIVGTGRRHPNSKWVAVMLLPL